MGTPIDINGQKFNKLTVVGIDHLGKSNKIYWRCVCDCGNETTSISADLKSGKRKSCGCEIRRHLLERNTKHGMKDTRLYGIWRSMIARCRYKNLKSYKDYGGRGIRVCSEWEKEFLPFYEWAISNGYSDKLTIERNNNDGNYCPQNCSWITKAEQALNKRPRSSIPDRDKKGRFVCAK